MRVTEQARLATRERILICAARLFRAAGWEQATTRGIASAAGIAAGTIFNYFPAKEAIAVALATRALAEAARDFQALRRADASLEEDLFVFIWAGFRRLEPERNWLAHALSAITAPVPPRAAPPSGNPGPPARQKQSSPDSLASTHLPTVARILAEHGFRATPAQMQLYWTLYTGILAHWTTDDSDYQQDTLALLDQALILFAGSLKPDRDA